MALDLAGANDANRAMADTFFSDSRGSTNATEYTVSEISGALKRAIEDQFGNVRVRGEISGYRGPHSSGHAYFALKDDRARLEAVVWKTTMARLRFRPEEGMEVIATGRLTTYPGSSKYQIVIDNLEPAGAGALMALLEERKKRLAAEGLFDAARKHRLPYMPRVIGVITSPTGAVIRDIIHRIKDRFPVHVVVWPIRVQGETAGPEAAAAVTGFNMLKPGGPIPRPDVLIVARGGGSLEDLWGFNEEEVVRAAAASKIPLISAVGHETDTTLIDFASDKRAPTPTAAAEMVVPVRADLVRHVTSLEARNKDGLLRTLTQARQRLIDISRGLPRAQRLLETPRQRLDYAGSNLAGALRIQVQRQRTRLERAGAALTIGPIQRGMGHQRQRLDDMAQRMRAAVSRRVTDSATRLQAEAKLLETLSHKSTLGRGFAMVTKAGKGLVTTSGQVQPGDELQVTFADGSIDAVAAGSAGTPPKQRVKSVTSKQGDLF